MTTGNGNGYGQVVLDVLDRMIDEGIKNAEALTALRHTITETRTDLQKFATLIEKELRTEIKDHVSAEADRIKDVIRDDLKGLDKLSHDLQPVIQDHDEFRKTQQRANKFFDKLNSPMTYFKLFMAFLAAIVTFSSAVGTLLWKIDSWKKTPSQPTNIVQPQQGTGNSP